VIVELNSLPLPWLVSGEGGAAEGGSDGAAREGGKRYTIPLVLIESYPEISCHFVVSKNVCEGVRVKQPNNHFDGVDVGWQ